MQKKNMIFGGNEINKECADEPQWGCCYDVTQLSKIKEFTPSSGSVIFFQSTPNSYHGVNLFREVNGKKRFFIYGSYALSTPVVWKYKNVSYVPFIKKTNKKLLTSSHDSDYLLRKAS